MKAEYLVFDWVVKDYDVFSTFEEAVTCQEGWIAFHERNKSIVGDNSIDIYECVSSIGWKK